MAGIQTHLSKENWCWNNSARLGGKQQEAELTGLNTESQKVLGKVRQKEL